MGGRSSGRSSSKVRDLLIAKEDRHGRAEEKEQLEMEREKIMLVFSS